MASADDQRAWNQMSYEGKRYVLSQNYPNGIPQSELDKLDRDEIARQYGYLAVYLDDPEVGPLLRRAAQEGWTQERLQGELYTTQFWQRTSEATRQWDLLTRTDPAEVTKRITDLSSELRNQVDLMGYGDIFDDNMLRVIAGSFLHDGLTQAQMKTALVSEGAKRSPAGGTPSGQIGMTMNQVKSRASDYGLPMSDEAANWWGQQVTMGRATPDSFDVYLRNQAKSRYSWLSEDIDRGATVRQLFDPMLQQTAQLLEISPTKIDLTDPKYSAMIDHVDSSGQRRSMTTAEAATYIRSQPEWQQTENATKAASTAAESILRTFGKVAA